MMIVQISFLLIYMLGINLASAQLYHNVTQTTRIVGGTNSRQGEFPYQMVLLRNRLQVCGGALVVIKGRQVVLTAAHCIDRGLRSEYQVIAGDYDRRDRSGHEQICNITRVIRHENYYRGSELLNDIAMIFIDSPFELNANVAPIPLPRQGQEFTGYAIATGWGATISTGGGLPPILQKIQIPFVDNAACARSYARVRANIYPTMICAGGEEGRGFCFGDSGGPLRAVNGGYLAGLSSFTRERCAVSGYPSVATKVSHYINWLNSKVQDCDDETVSAFFEIKICSLK